MKSNREDGLGHWPKGKRRNIDTGDWQQIRLGVQSILDQHGERGVFSLGVIAEALACDKKTVSKWLKGINRPGQQDQDALRVWLKEAREKVGRKKHA